MLADGSYDTIVVDANETDDGSITVELTVLAGAHKGEMVSVTADGMQCEPLELLATPATLTVVNGEPTLRLEG